MAEHHLLRRAAEQATGRPFYLASVLLPLARAEQLDDDALAARLGCPPDMLPALLLCRRPADASFLEDVRRIAARFHLDPVPLAESIRLANALQTLSDSDATFLAAARDREPNESPNP